MNLIYEYLRERSIFIDETGERASRYCQAFSDSLTKDDSGFVVVDGEEGDHGTIHYAHDGQQIATLTIHGGDSEEVEFTEYGKSLLKHHCLRLLLSLLE